jgi:hypothetical protein
MVRSLSRTKRNKKPETLKVKLKMISKNLHVNRQERKVKEAELSGVISPENELSLYGEQVDEINCIQTVNKTTKIGKVVLFSQD